MRGTPIDRLAEGRRVFDVEIDALGKMRDALDGTFEQVLDLIVNCKGKVVITGMGKPGHVGTKIAATMASLGTPAFFLHPAEAMHGDLGMVSADDVVIAMSYSGESDEIVRILPNLKLIGATVVGITGNASSTLARHADVVQLLPEFEEACYLGLAPTSSTTVELAYGDALAVVASGIYGFKDADFGRFHPAGALGKKLILKVDDLMVSDDADSRIGIGARLKDAIVEIGKKELGIVTVIADDGTLAGVITDGDLRRQLEREADIYSMGVVDIMTAEPKTVELGRLAAEALALMNEANVSALPVMGGRRPVGTVCLKAITRAGIVA